MANAGNAEYALHGNGAATETHMIKVLRRLMGTPLECVALVSSFLHGCCIALYFGLVCDSVRADFTASEPLRVIHPLELGLAFILAKHFWSVYMLATLSNTNQADAQAQVGNLTEKILGTYGFFVAMSLGITVTRLDMSKEGLTQESFPQYLWCVVILLYYSSFYGPERIEFPNVTHFFGWKGEMKNVHIVVHSLCLILSCLCSLTSTQIGHFDACTICLMVCVAVAARLLYNSINYNAAMYVESMYLAFAQLVLIVCIIHLLSHNHGVTVGGDEHGVAVVAGVQLRS
jgi:hypothetical protein